MFNGASLDLTSYNSSLDNSSVYMFQLNSVPVATLRLLVSRFECLMWFNVRDQLSCMKIKVMASSICK